MIIRRIALASCAFLILLSGCAAQELAEPENSAAMGTSQGGIPAPESREYEPKPAQSVPEPSQPEVSAQPDEAVPAQSGEENSAASEPAPEPVVAEPVPEPEQPVSAASSQASEPPGETSVPESPLEREQVLPSQSAPEQTFSEQLAEEGSVYYSAAAGRAASPEERVIDSEGFELELLRLINLERQIGGMNPLGLEERMQWAARIRSPEVLGSLSHTRPDNTAYYTAFDEAGFVYAGKWHGENVGYMYFTEGTYNTVEAAGAMFAELKSSPGHYANMLSENFSQIGVGACVEQEGGIVRVGSAQLFAGF